MAAHSVAVRLSDGVLRVVYLGPRRGMLATRD